MKLLADRNIERQLVGALNADGHDVISAKDMGADPGDDVLIAQRLKAPHDSRTHHSAVASHKNSC